MVSKNNGCNHGRGSVLHLANGCSDLVSRPYYKDSFLLVMTVEEIKQKFERLSVQATEKMGEVVAGQWVSHEPNPDNVHIWFITEMQMAFVHLRGRGWCPAIESDLEQCPKTEI